MQVMLDVFLLIQIVNVYFFFSSRRRHTRSLCDWSSDVCSSDLTIKKKIARIKKDGFVDIYGGEPTLSKDFLAIVRQIGRASCRERVQISGVAVSLKKKIKFSPIKWNKKSNQLSVTFDAAIVVDDNRYTYIEASFDTLRLT